MCYNVLGLMGIGNTFCGWIGLLWSGMRGIISYDGIIQEEIPMTNGLTQGAPKSAFLFNIALIPLIRAINNARINSPSLSLYLAEIQHRDEAKRRKAFSYSDDIQIIVNFNKDDILNTLQIIKDFTYVSGQGLNEDKNSAILSFKPTNTELEMLESCFIQKKMLSPLVRMSKFWA